MAQFSVQQCLRRVAGLLGIGLFFCGAVNASATYQNPPWEPAALENALAAASAPATVANASVLAWHIISFRTQPVAEYAFVWLRLENKGAQQAWALAQMVRVVSSTDPLSQQWQVRRVGGVPQFDHFAQSPTQTDVLKFLRQWGWRITECHYSVIGAVDERRWQALIGAPAHVDYFRDPYGCTATPQNESGNID